jgi:1,4-dihydroxy-2-naphthoate octaprenyltransferase
MSDENKKFRTVNRMLGQRASFGPIPPEQLVSWVLIIVFSYLVGSFLDFDLFHMFIMAAVLCSTWWILTGKRSWVYLSKFISAPRWVRASVAREVLSDVDQLEIVVSGDGS